jgi:hypothetical protein
VRIRDVFAVGVHVRIADGRGHSSGAGAFSRKRQFRVQGETARPQDNTLREKKKMLGNMCDGDEAMMARVAPLDGGWRDSSMVV